MNECLGLCVWSEICITRFSRASISGLSQPNRAKIFFFPVVLWNEQCVAFGPDALVLFVGSREHHRPRYSANKWSSQLLSYWTLNKSNQDKFKRQCLSANWASERTSDRSIQFSRFCRRSELALLTLERPTGSAPLTRFQLLPSSSSAWWSFGLWIIISR